MPERIPPASRPDQFRWDDLRLFLVAHRSGSLTRAATQLGLNQSTTSRRLKAFEEIIGGALFDRTPDGLLLTELGEQLLAPAERAEAASYEVARLCLGTKAELEGEVRLAISEGLSYYVIAPTVPKLLELHPKIRLSMLVSEAIADLTRREADIAMRFFRPTRGDLVAQRIFAGGYALFAAPSWIEQSGPGPHAHAGLPFIGWDVNQSHFPEGGWEVRAGVECVTRASSMPTRIALAQAGCGAIQLPQMWGRALPGLTELDADPPELRAEVWLVTHRGIRDVPRIRAVWDFVVEQFAEFVGAMT